MAETVKKDDDTDRKLGQIVISRYNTSSLLDLLFYFFARPFFLMLALGGLKHQLQLDTPNIAYWTSVLIVIVGYYVFGGSPFSTARIRYMVEKIAGFSK